MTNISYIRMVAQQLSMCDPKPTVVCWLSGMCGICVLSPTMKLERIMLQNQQKNLSTNSFHAVTSPATSSFPSIGLLSLTTQLCERSTSE